MAYRTKTQKRNALKAIDHKAMQLFMSGTLTIAQADRIAQVVKAGMKKL
jgi:hypothetical protein